MAFIQRHAILTTSFPPFGDYWMNRSLPTTDVFLQPVKDSGNEWPFLGLIDMLLEPRFGQQVP